MSTNNSLATAHVTFGQVTVVVFERVNTPPPELVKVPNPYMRQTMHPMFAHLFAAPPFATDAITMVIRFTKELANQSPDLCVPETTDEW